MTLRTGKQTRGPTGSASGSASGTRSLDAVTRALRCTDMCAINCKKKSESAPPPPSPSRVQLEPRTDQVQYVNDGQSAILDASSGCEH